MNSSSPNALARAPSSNRSMPADGRKDVSSKHWGLVFWEGASRSGAGDRVGCKMPLTALRFAFQENVDERRFGRLAHLLTVIQLEIERESADLGPFVERMTDCAAFSSEAMENGEVPEHMSARIDALARKLALNRERQVSLEQQMSFVDRTRKGLLRILPPHGA